jgi:hypothetical protein
VLQQADDADDAERGRPRKHPAPFTSRCKAEADSCQREQKLRPVPPKAMHEGCDRKQAEAEREDVEHRGARLHSEHLVEERDCRGGNRRRLSCKQREPAEIDRDHRKRAEQRARIAPAERVIAERPDRQRDQLLSQRRMHRIE